MRPYLYFFKDISFWAAARGSSVAGFTVYKLIKQSLENRLYHMMNLANCYDYSPAVGSVRISVLALPAFSNIIGL